MADARVPLSAGKDIGGYVIEKVLGAGGFGLTYLAHEAFTKRPVVVKEMMPSELAMRKAGSDEVVAARETRASELTYLLERFRTEAQTLVALDHPNIVRTLRYFEANGTGHLVMAHAEGETLADLLDKKARIPEPQLLAWLLPLLDALEYIHGRKYLHRDIKPANILIRTDGSPVFLDFGAARQLLAQHVGDRVATAIWSEGYTPPEQYREGPGQGEWSDIFAMGATLYRCMSGAQPRSSMLRQTMARDGAPDPVLARLEELRGQYSPALVEIVAQCLELARERRPQSASALRRELTERGLVAKAERFLAARAQPRVYRRFLLAGGVVALALIAMIVALPDSTLCGGSGTWSWSTRECYRLEVLNPLPSVKNTPVNLCVPGTMLPMMRTRDLKLKAERYCTDAEWNVSNVATNQTYVFWQVPFEDGWLNCRCRRRPPPPQR